MALTTDQKKHIVKEYQVAELDTGSSEVQVALLTARIQQLTEHFKINKKDFHGRNGLVRMVNRRRKLLDYLKNNSPERYTNLIGKLGIRK